MIIKPLLKTWRHRWAWITMSVLLAGFILFVSTRPVDSLRSAGYPDLGYLFDDLGHFVGYLLLSLLVRPALEGDPYQSTASHRSRAVIGVIALVCAWGFLCEIVQLMVPGRGVQVIDFLANMSPAPLSQLALGFIVPKPLTGGS